MFELRKISKYINHCLAPMLMVTKPDIHVIVQKSVIIRMCRDSNKVLEPITIFVIEHQQCICPFFPLLKSKVKAAGFDSGGKDLIISNTTGATVSPDYVRCLGV